MKLTDRQKERAAKAAEALARWQRKLGSARRRVAKYGRTVAYYDKLAKATAPHEDVLRTAARHLEALGRRRGSSGALAAVAAGFGGGEELLS